jgi:hypothetical protein
MRTGSVKKFMQMVLLIKGACKEFCVNGFALKSSVASPQT